jgi:hypothetical protein
MATGQWGAVRYGRNGVAGIPECMEANLASRICAVNGIAILCRRRAVLPKANAAIFLIALDP